MMHSKNWLVICKNWALCVEKYWCAGVRTKFWQRKNVGVRVRTLNFGTRGKMLVVRAKFWCTCACAKFWHRVEKCWCAGAHTKFSIAWCAYA
jgi:hypothetical protein